MVDFGTIKTTDKDGDQFDRCTKIITQFIEYVKFHNPSNIAIEGLAFGMKGNATRDLAGLLYVVVTSLRKEGFFPIIITPLSLKKFATGSGKADKSQMIASLPADVINKFQEKNYKKTTGLADLADAYWLAKYAQHK